MKPMLAATPKSMSELRFPYYASPKLDGIRAIVQNGVVVSRKLLPIPNQHVQNLFGRPENEGLDGELIVGLPYGDDVFHRTSGAVRRKDGEPDVTLNVFDLQLPGGRPYKERWGFLVHNSPLHPYIHLVEHRVVYNLEELEDYEDMLLGMGYEGVMLNSPDGIYKQGRSTMRENYLIKIKRCVECEAVVYGYEEEMFNGNEATTNALGNTKRSSHKANKKGKNTLGALLVRNRNGEFRVGVFLGVTAAERKEWWDNKEQLIGKVCKVRYFPKGVVDRPRHSRFVGWRDAWDM